MKKGFLLIILSAFISHALPVIAESNLSVSLARMEREWLHKEFVNDNDEIRISRLEENVFGTIHDIDIKSRYNHLKKAFNAKKNNYLKTSRDYLFGTPTSIPINIDELTN